MDQREVEAGRTANRWDTPVERVARGVPGCLEDVRLRYLTTFQVRGAGRYGSLTRASRLRRATTTGMEPNLPEHAPDTAANLPWATLRQSPPETLADVDRTWYDEATQTMPREQLLQLQLDRARVAVDRALNRPIPFFARKLAEAGIESAADLGTIDDLDAVPLTVKDELRASEAEHPPVGDYRGTELRDNVRIGTSTGTTGTPTHSLWTRNDLLVDYELGARMFWSQGVRPGMVMTHAHPAYLYAGGPMLQGVYEHLGCLSVWVPPPETDELAEQGLRFWERVTPDRPFMGFATGRFFEVAGKLGLDPKSVGLDFSNAPQLNVPGEPMGLMTCGAEALPYAGVSVPGVSGAYVPDDYSYIQAVDPDTGRSVPDGEWGHLVVTTFGRDNFLVRYDLEEAVKVDRSQGHSDCTHARGWWGGRFKDLVRVQGKALLPLEIESALRTVRAIRKPSLEYQVVRPAPDARDLPLVVRVEVGEGAGEDRTALANEVAAELEGSLGVKADVEVLDREALPRSGYKAQRILDAG